jgi:Uma2 family endonuclease
MPTVAPEIPGSIVQQSPPRKRWTRAECEIMEAAGLFEQERVELVNGELITKMGKKRPHSDTANQVYGWLIQIFGLSYVNAETPIDVAPEDNPTNEPVPDLIVLKRSFSNFRSATPQPADLELVVEVADSSLNFDLTVKAGLYARAGIIEYWVLDVNNCRLIAHRDPRDGRYQSKLQFSADERIAPLGAPNSPFRVGSAFRV